jgi:putative hydrolase of HD superfamily
MNHENLLKLAFELGILSRTPRSGPYHVAVADHLTIAAHSYRQMVIAYFMACEEKADSGKVLKMCMVSDMPETRVQDQTFVQKKYFDLEKVAPDILKDQLRAMKGSEELQKLHHEMRERTTLEAKIASDAGKLETLIEAKEQIQKGVTVMERWFIDKKKELLTKTGRELFDALQKGEIFWWTD